MRASIPPRERGVRTPRSPLLFALAAALVALAIAALGCSGSNAQDVEDLSPEVAAEAKPERAGKERDERPLVRTRTLEPGPFVERFVVTAEVGLTDEIALASEFGGFVNAVAFDKGQRVDQGALLARVGDDLAEAQLEQARADMMAADANFTRATRLFEREAIPQQELVAATSRRDRTRAQVREMEIRLERALIRAPVAGSMLDRLVEPGEVVPPGTVIGHLLDLSSLVVEASVPDTEAAWLEPGRPARFFVDAYPEEVFEAEISFVAPAADPTSRTFDVELEIEGSRERAMLRPGMVGRAELVRRELDEAIVVPIDALLPRREGQVAFIVEECRAALRRVRLGAREGERVRVIEGLSAGDDLVVRGQQDLAEGQPVRTETCP